VGNIQKNIKNNREERAGEISTTKKPSVKTNLYNKKILGCFLTDIFYENPQCENMWFHFCSFWEHFKEKELLLPCSA
jgi:hypothetical protein